MEQEKWGKCLCRRWNRTIRKVHLVDKCLIVFMLLLLAQSIYNLFSTPPTSDFAGNIDVVMRTAAASIFGYFISANFIRKWQAPNSKIIPPTKELPPAGLSPTLPQNTPAMRIGFEDASCPGQQLCARPVELYEQRPEKPEWEHRHLQIIITTFIGIASLIALIIYRNFCVTDLHDTGTIAQLRDFVSSCVGFLIGSVTDENQTE